MLFYSTIELKTLQLLKELQGQNAFSDFMLAGGTSLALQIGHRISVDLDLFTTVPTDVSTIPELIAHLGQIRVVNQTSSILNLFIDDIKVDFVVHPYGFINPCVTEDEIRLVSVQDIAAMKLAAITGRGSRKDFIDLFFLLESFPLGEMFEFYKQKYANGSDFLVYKSLTYFVDAEIEPIPKMLQPLDWETVKNRIIKEVKACFP